MKKDITISTILLIYFIILGFLYMGEYNKLYLLMIGIGIIAAMFLCVIGDDDGKDDLIID